ncbi:MAG: hypothetical protein VB032_04010 [Burkholderiaceae bacterium]|nr:hypothetical protein [Burkholderiaceae bacterium]
MNTLMKAAQPVSGDVECGAIDSGLAEDVVVRKTVSVVSKACADDDDPQADINCYGVGVIKADALSEEEPKN